MSSWRTSNLGFVPSKFYLNATSFSLRFLQFLWNLIIFYWYSTLSYLNILLSFWKPTNAVYLIYYKSLSIFFSITFMSDRIWAISILGAGNCPFNSFIPYYLRDQVPVYERKEEEVDQELWNLKAHVQLYEEGRLEDLLVVTMAKIIYWSEEVCAKSVDKVFWLQH